MAAIFGGKVGQAVCALARLPVSLAQQHAFACAPHVVPSAACSGSINTGSTMSMMSASLV